MSSRSNLDQMDSHEIWSLSIDDIVELAVQYHVDVPYLDDGDCDEDELAHRLDLLRNERLAEAAAHENR